MFNYQGKIIEIIDGDSLDIQVDLGLHTDIIQTFRVNNVAIWELAELRKRPHC